MPLHDIAHFISLVTRDDLCPPSANYAYNPILIQAMLDSFTSAAVLSCFSQGLSGSALLAQQDQLLLGKH